MSLKIMECMDEDSLLHASWVCRSWRELFERYDVWRAKAQHGYWRVFAAA